MKTIRPPSSEHYLTVLMQPKHFVAYQRWLSALGLQLFILPLAPSSNGPAYAVTRAARLHENDPVPAPTRRGKHGALKNTEGGTA